MLQPHRLKGSAGSVQWWQTPQTPPEVRTQGFTAEHCIAAR